jgi:hypothetical protein
MRAAAKATIGDRLGLFMALSDDMLVRAFWRGTARGPISLHGGGDLRSRLRLTKRSSGRSCSRCDHSTLLGSRSTCPLCTGTSSSSRLMTRRALPCCG